MADSKAIEAGHDVHAGMLGKYVSVTDEGARLAGVVCTRMARCKRRAKAGPTFYVGSTRDHAGAFIERV